MNSIGVKYWSDASDLFYTFVKKIFSIMKKIFLILALIIVTFGAIAQKPVKNDKGFSFGLIGLNFIKVNTTPSNTGSLILKYYVKDNIAVRVGLMYGRNDTTTNSDTTGTGMLTATEKKHSNWAVSFGVQKAFGNIAKLESYIGADVFFGGKNGSMDSTITIKSSKYGMGTVGDFNKTVITNMGGFNWGVNGVLGFNYFFSDHFALGAEFRYGGKSTYESTGKTTNTLHVGGNTKPSTVTAGPAPVSIFNLGATGSGTVIVSIFF